MIPATVYKPSVPSDLKTKLADPKTPWHFSKTLFSRVSHQQTDKPYKTCEVLKTDPEYEFILKYFQYHQPPGVDIKRIVCIYNAKNTLSFEASIKEIDQEIDDPAFAPTWNKEEFPEERRKVIQRWKEFVGQFSPFYLGNGEQMDNPKVVPVWQGTSKEVCESICSSNFTCSGKYNYTNPTDKDVNFGNFGNGIYFTTSANYAAMFSGPSKIILLSWVSMRQPYPVIGNDPDSPKGSDVRTLKNQGAYLNYNAHYIPLASNTQNPMLYYPCYKNQEPAFDELVVFNSSQALPCFWIELAKQDDLLKNVEIGDINNPPDLFHWGMCHLKGVGTPKNPQKAVTFFEKAAAQNHAPSIFQLATCHEEGVVFDKNLKEAALLYEKAANLGLNTAQCKIGACYFRGQGVQKDPAKAVEWYKKAAAQNFPLAQYYLGSCLMKGTGIGKDTKQGIELHCKAAEQGVVPAQYYLGMFYLNGEGVSKDIKQASLWFEKAASQGDKDAITILKSIKEKLPAKEIL